jgi:asparagine synthetase B (glutamine-hydrolysing)
LSGEGADELWGYFIFHKAPTHENHEENVRKLGNCICNV